MPYAKGLFSTRIPTPNEWRKKMSRFKLCLAAVALLGLTFFAADSSMAQGQYGKGRPRMMCQDHFTSLDTNKDGKVDEAEFAAIEHRRGTPEEIFKARDTNADGLLTMEEFCSGGYGRRGRSW